MSLQKRPLKTKPVSKVTFRLPPEAAPKARKVALVGDFNEWSPKATPMQKLKTGEFKVTLDLEQGKPYNFRYLIDGQIWANDKEADGYAPSGFSDAENSVVVP